MKATDWLLALLTVVILTDACPRPRPAIRLQMTLTQPVSQPTTQPMMFPHADHLRMQRRPLTDGVSLDSDGFYEDPYDPCDGRE